MKWLSITHEHHPKREWHPYGFAWWPVEINLVTYWLCWPPSDKKLVKQKSFDEARYYKWGLGWEFRPHSTEREEYER